MSPPAASELYRIDFASSVRMASKASYDLTASENPSFPLATAFYLAGTIAYNSLNCFVLLALVSSFFPIVPLVQNIVDTAYQGRNKRIRELIVSVATKDTRIRDLESQLAALSNTKNTRIRELERQLKQEEQHRRAALAKQAADHAAKQAENRSELRDATEMLSLSELSNKQLRTKLDNVKHLDSSIPAPNLRKFTRLQENTRRAKEQYELEKAELNKAHADEMNTLRLTLQKEHEDRVQQITNDVPHTFESNKILRQKVVNLDAQCDSIRRDSERRESLQRSRVESEYHFKTKALQHENRHSRWLLNAAQKDLTNARSKLSASYSTNFALRSQLEALEAVKVSKATTTAPQAKIDELESTEKLKDDETTGSISDTIATLVPPASTADEEQNEINHQDMPEQESQPSTAPAFSASSSAPSNPVPTEHDAPSADLPTISLEAALTEHNTPNGDLPQDSPETTSPTENYAPSADPPRDSPEATTPAEHDTPSAEPSKDSPKSISPTEHTPTSADPPRDSPEVTSPTQDPASPVEITHPGTNEMQQPSPPSSHPSPQVDESHGSTMDHDQPQIPDVSVESSRPSQPPQPMITEEQPIPASSSELDVMITNEADLPGEDPKLAMDFADIVKGMDVLRLSSPIEEFSVFPLPTEPEDEVLPDVPQSSEQSDPPLPVSQPAEANPVKTADQMAGLEHSTESVDEEIPDRPESTVQPDPSPESQPTEAEPIDSGNQMAGLQHSTESVDEEIPDRPDSTDQSVPVVPASQPTEADPVDLANQMTGLQESTGPIDGAVSDLSDLLDQLAPFVPDSQATEAEATDSANQMIGVSQSPQPVAGAIPDLSGQMAPFLPFSQPAQANSAETVNQTTDLPSGEVVPEFPDFFPWHLFQSLPSSQPGPIDPTLDQNVVNLQPTEPQGGPSSQFPIFVPGQTLPSLPPFQPVTDAVAPYEPPEPQWRNIFDDWIDWNESNTTTTQDPSVGASSNVVGDQAVQGQGESSVPRPADVSEPASNTTQHPNVGASSNVVSGQAVQGQGESSAPQPPGVGEPAQDTGDFTDEDFPTPPADEELVFDRPFFMDVAKFISETWQPLDFGQQSTSAPESSSVNAGASIPIDPALLNLPLPSQPDQSPFQEQSSQDPSAVPPPNRKRHALPTPRKRPAGLIPFAVKDAAEYDPLMPKPPPATPPQPLPFVVNVVDDENDQKDDDKGKGKQPDYGYPSPISSFLSSPPLSPYFPDGEFDLAAEPPTMTALPGLKAGDGEGGVSSPENGRVFEDPNLFAPRPVFDFEKERVEAEKALGKDKDDGDGDGDGEEESEESDEDEDEEKGVVWEDVTPNPADVDAEDREFYGEGG
ncbi:MAG: hypothetical protein Q9219_006528 [cf. Caloplaca sp. 3 TL-2023]